MAHEWGMVVVVAIVATAACDPGPTPAPSVTPPSPAVARCAVPTTPPDIECYPKDQMQPLVDRTILLVRQFFDETYKALPHPTKFIYIATGTKGISACTDGKTYETTDASFFYCSADREIYTGQE